MKIVTGIAAHADAGKTTLAEAMLYTAGTLRRMGRVDSGSAFLDTSSMEKERGITVFSHQAVTQYNDTGITILDTPGHSDFSAEAERTLTVLDACILVVSGTDGVQSHTLTLWKLLDHYDIPVIVFVSKADISHDMDSVMRSLAALSDRIVPYDEESLAEADEELMEAYIEGDMDEDMIRRAFNERRIFPVFTGAPLKGEGIEPLLDALTSLVRPKSVHDSFSAKVYKISAEGNARLTHMKVTGGTLRVKDMIGEEKAEGIRIYSGAKFERVQQAEAGDVIAVAGLTVPVPGTGLGEEPSSRTVLEPVMRYTVTSGEDDHTLYEHLSALAAEEPSLSVRDRDGEISVGIMGDIYLEVLSRLYSERYGCEPSFGTGRISYRETIAAPVTGVGHYEPLRHYAEVQVELSPLPEGSGIICASDCPEDVLHRRFQHMILSSIEGKEHLGVLTGSPLTDVKITLLTGKAHIKHTEGGDFRQASIRAVRNALMYADSVLLEPYGSFTLTIPANAVGRALTDLQRMDAQMSPPDISGSDAVITGSAPMSGLSHYMREVRSYTGGSGSLITAFDGYKPCRDAESVIEAAAYDPTADLANSPDSVFCIHGAGTVIRWDMVRDYMHTEESSEPAEPVVTPAQVAQFKARLYSDDELMAIFERTYGKIERPKRYAMRREPAPGTKVHRPKTDPDGKDYLIADGYNLIFAWDELKALARDNLDLARKRLTDILINYTGFKGCETILVFDAYRTSEERRIERVNNITVVYTKEAETADMYIERAAHELRPKARRIRVATSDYAEQLIILGSGALRISAREFEEETKQTAEAIRSLINSE